MHILEMNDFREETGGAERHFHSLCTLLEEKGEKVSRFHALDHYGRRRAADVTAALEGHLKRETPDIAHIHVLDHRFLPLLSLLDRLCIPIVQTVHDHRAVCAATSMQRRGALCTECRGGRHYMAGFRGCINFPLALSLFARTLFRSSSEYNKVSLFISPSAFLIDTFRAWGFEGAFVHLRNFLEMQDYVPSYEDSGYCLFFGRFTAIKGISTLIEAVSSLPLSLKIVGGGEMDDEVRKRSASAPDGRITVEGWKKREDLIETIKGARFVIVPSECYENSPFAVMESFALGKAVIGSDLGGIAELVGKDERGMLFPAGDGQALRKAVEYLWNDRAASEAQGRMARHYAESHFHPGPYYDRLMELFQKVRGDYQRRRRP